MDQRLTYDEDLVNYEKWRTNYCDELFSAIIGHSGVGAGKLAVEPGCGTGKSTEPILKTGCTVIGVEYGRNLAAFAKDKFSGYNNFHIENMKFEDFQHSSDTVDLVYSGTAFHWIPEETGYAKAFNLLRSGGTLALFWSFPAPDIDRDTLREKMLAAYDRYDPNERLRSGDKSYGQRTPIAETIKKYGFTDVEHCIYKIGKTYSAYDYVAVLNTFATHLMIKPDSVRKQYEQEIKDAINSSGGFIEVYDVMDLFLARKP